MYALIKKENGEYYGSTVFGYYTNAKPGKKHQYNGFSIYYVVFSEDKKRLVKCHEFRSESQYIDKMVLIVDSDRSDWQFNMDRTGGVSFLPREIANRCIDQDYTPTEILEQCLEIENNYIYDAYPVIRNEKDIEDLYWVSQCFHDAYIVEQKMVGDDELYVRFDGVWGCSIEVWFSGNLEYDTSSRDPDTCDPYWYGSTTLIQDGFVYLIDDDDMTVEKIRKGYCWFKARNMKYHVIPVKLDTES